MLHNDLDLLPSLKNHGEAVDPRAEGEARTYEIHFLSSGKAFYPKTINHGDLPYRLGR
jgi:hypothetical protein